MRASFPQVVLQMCIEDFFSSLQILGRLPLHSLPAFLVWIHCKTVKLYQLYQTPIQKEKYCSCLNWTEKTLSWLKLAFIYRTRSGSTQQTIHSVGGKSVFNLWFVTSCFYSGPITCLVPTRLFKFLIIPPALNTVCVKDQMLCTYAEPHSAAGPPRSYSSWKLPRSPRWPRCPVPCGSAWPPPPGNPSSPSLPCFGPVKEQMGLSTAWKVSWFSWT